VLGLNGLFYLIIAGPLNSVAWTWQFAVSAVAGCRLVLHMHTAGTPHPSAATPSAASSAPRRAELTTFDPGPSFELRSMSGDDATAEGDVWSPRTSSSIAFAHRGEHSAGEDGWRHRA
jgi:hypothetical protein